MILRKIMISFVALAASSLFFMPSSTQAADHGDAPLISSFGDLDVNDLYAFQSPSDPTSTVLIMTINPFAGVASGTEFSTSAEYEFLVDNDNSTLR